jgi:hypothetical protein
MLSIVLVALSVLPPTFCVPAKPYLAKLGWRPGNLCFRPVMIFTDSDLTVGAGCVDFG